MSGINDVPRGSGCVVEGMGAPSSRPGFVFFCFLRARCSASLYFLTLQRRRRGERERCYAALLTSRLPREAEAWVARGCVRTSSAANLTACNLKRSHFATRCPRSTALFPPRAGLLLVLFRFSETDRIICSHSLGDTLNTSSFFFFFCKAHTGTFKGGKVKHYLGGKGQPCFGSGPSLPPNIFVV